MATSDERAKNKLGPIPDGILPLLKLLKLYVYEWKDDGSLDAGPMAQELFRLFGKKIEGIVKYKKDRTVPTSLEEIAERGPIEGALVVEHNALTLHFQSSLVGTRGLLTVQHRVASTMDTNYSSKLYICVYIIDSHVVIHIQLYMMTTYLRILEI